MRYKCHDCDATFRAENGVERGDLQCPKCGGRLSLAEEPPPKPTPEAEREPEQRPARSNTVAWIIGAVVIVVGVALMLLFFGPDMSHRPDSEEPSASTAQVSEQSPKKTPENPDAKTAKPIPLRPGWRRVPIPNIGTIDMPPTMKVQHGALNAVGKAMTEALDTSGPRDDTRLVIQQKELSEAPEAYKRYVRVIVSSRRADPAERNGLASPTPSELEELSQGIRQLTQDQGNAMSDRALAAATRRLQRLTDSELKEVARPFMTSQAQRDKLAHLTQAELQKLRAELSSAYTAAIKTKQVRILDWYRATHQRVSGRRAACVSYSRQMGQAPPVFVRMYLLLDGDRILTLTVSYREAEKERWARDLEYMIKSFRTN